MSHTLLLADDSVTVQRVIELTFADEGFKVVSFSDGDEAVGYLEAGNAPDVILADTTMPARDGYDVSAWVKGRDALGRVPVVLMTGAFEPIDEKRAEACHADAVLVKPFEPQQVVSLVKRMLAGDRGALLGEFAPPRRAAGVSPAESVVSLGPGFDTYAARLDEHLAARQGRAVLTPAEAVADRGPLPDEDAADTAEPNASLAEAFSAILAAESGEAPDPDLPAAAAAATAAVPDALIDAVVERVLARMSDEVVREVVSRHVLDVAERLITREIERIKSGLP
jgi:CheY-like chemotaxis protein